MRLSFDILVRPIDTPDGRQYTRDALRLLDYAARLETLADVPDEQIDILIGHAMLARTVIQPPSFDTKPGPRFENYVTYAGGQTP